jgi:hypothetical protein
MDITGQPMVVMWQITVPLLNAQTPLQLESTTTHMEVIPAQGVV